MENRITDLEAKAIAEKAWDAAIDCVNMTAHGRVEKYQANSIRGCKVVYLSQFSSPSSPENI